MGDTLSVSIDTSKDVAQPTLEELAAQVDEQFPELDGDRPEWLPEKFKSAEDLAKAYQELERKLSSKTPPEATEKAQDGEDEDLGTEVADEEVADSEASVEAAREATEKAGLNFDELSQKYWENGTLDKTDYEALEKSGIPKNLVDQFIAGQEAILEATRGQVFNAVGGEEAYTEIVEWAAENMDRDEIIAYNRAVDGADRAAAMMAVKGLKARYDAEVGFEPRRSVSGATAKAGAAVYRSIAEMEKDMSDPRYKTDSAFRRDVERKLANSDIM